MPQNRFIPPTAYGRKSVPFRGPDSRFTNFGFLFRDFDSTGFVEEPYLMNCALVAQ